MGRRSHLSRLVGGLVLALAGIVAAAAPQGAVAQERAGLRAGVGKSDITPQTGYYLGGWTRADRTAQGQHTRLESRAIVLERNGRKVALVQVDLFMIPGGMLKQIGDGLRSRGFSERNILVSPSHTHSGPGGYANFPTLNTAAPSLETASDPFSFARLADPAPADRQLYTFLLKQISAAIQRADADLGPAEAGWGSSTLPGITRNRSIEAHLANHGFDLEYGQGKEEQDPGGYLHTIDPAVSVLRVDKIVRRRVRGKRRRVRVPVGGWSNFANHGTVTQSTFEYYNADHHASAMRVFEDRIRKSAKVPRGQQIVNVYGTSNEGDQSAGLERAGPAQSDYVGRVEAGAMLAAWRAARRDMSRTPALETRWTRVCFCGQDVDGGKVADESQVGIPFLTGSEEERGPLFDITGEHFEGRRAPTGADPHGRKIFPPGAGGGVPNGVPLMAVRVGKQMIVSLPGEGTKEVGARIKSAVALAIQGSGVRKAVLSGLANEFVLYFTTPEEYEKQHYEGGNTHFGRVSSVLMRNEIARLASTLAYGAPAPAPYAFDPTNGVVPNGAPYSSGSANGIATAQPAPSYGRLQHANFSWKGGPKGLDRPVDRAFVTAQRRKGRRWVRADSDLGLAMLWTVDDEGRHSVKWEIPLEAKPGRYRLLVTAKRYRLASRPFSVGFTRALKVFEVPAASGRVAVGLEYPGARRDIDLTHRPQYSRGGVVRFRVGNRDVRVKLRRGRFFSVRAPRGQSVTVPAGQGRDRFGNRNAVAFRVR